MSQLRAYILIYSMARPEKIIDWKQVEQRMEAGNSARQIASVFRIDINTFYDRFKKEYGKGFADFFDGFSECGKANIEYTQYLKALSGNVQTLLWLGQVKCGQKIPDGSNQNTPPLDVIIEKDNENMQLKAKIAKLEEQIANQSQTGS